MTAGTVDLPEAGAACCTVAGVDFASREPSGMERNWGAVARPVGMGPLFGLRLMTPLEVLSMRRAVLRDLFPEPGWIEAAEARARALLLLRAEGEKDKGGG